MIKFPEMCVTFLIDEAEMEAYEKIKMVSKMTRSSSVWSHVSLVRGRVWFGFA